MEPNQLTSGMEQNPTLIRVSYSSSNSLLESEGPVGNRFERLNLPLFALRPSFLVSGDAKKR